MAIIIPPGMNIDDSVFEVGQSAWADGDKVRFWRGLPQTIGGWEKISSTLLTGVCRSIFSWSDNLGQLNIGFGTNSHLEVFYGGQIYDITPASGFTPGLVDGTGGAGYGTGTYSTGLYSEPTSGSFYPLTWSLDSWGQNLMACPRGQTIFQWTNNTASPAAAVANAPANVTYMTTYDHQLFAFGCNEVLSGTFNPRCIRGTDYNDPTAWTPGLSSNAFEYILEGSGQIVAARRIGNYIFVWTDNAIYQGTLDPNFGWTFPLVAEHCGLMGPNAVVVISNQSAYWFGSNGQFYGCVLGGVPQIITSPLQEDVFTNITASQSDKIVVSSCAEYGELRMDYPDQRDGFENSRYVVYSTGGNLSAVGGYSRLDTVWSRGTMQRTAYVDAGPAPFPLGSDATGAVYYHERGQTADGAAIDAWIESADFYTGAAEEIMQIRGTWPDVKGQTCPINLTIYTRFYPQDALRTQGPFVLGINQSKRDFMCSGRIARLRYESIGNPTFWRLGKPVFDAIPAGTR